MYLVLLLFLLSFLLYTINILIFSAISTKLTVFVVSVNGGVRVRRQSIYLYYNELSHLYYVCCIVVNQSTCIIMNSLTCIMYTVLFVHELILSQSRGSVTWYEIIGVQLVTVLLSDVKSLSVNHVPILRLL